MRLRYVALAAFTFLLMWAAFGCAPSHPSAPIAATGTSIEKASSHIQSADNLVDKAIPESNHTGQVVLHAAKDEHASAQQELVAAKKELKAAQDASNTQAKTIKDQAGQITMYKNSWGWKLEVFVKAFVYILITLTILHFLLGAASLLIPVAFPAAITVVPILRVVGAVVNPLALPQFIFDHLHGIQCPPVKV